MSSNRPKAWRSPLREHLAEIRRMRRARHTWQEITDHLAACHGLRLTRSALCHFFRRATRRPLPMGFEDAPPQSEQAVELPRPNTARSTVAEESQPQTRGQQRISVMPIRQHEKHPWFGSWEPEQGINYVPKDQ
jgi:hypothetical protein